MFKFRSMREGAEDRTGPTWVDSDDPRVTRVGRLLRGLHLDEVPQCLNFLKGEMSLVGPRPLVKNQYDMIPEDLQQKIKLQDIQSKTTINLQKNSLLINGPGLFDYLYEVKLIIYKI